MKQKRRSPGFILALLCTFTLLLVACRSGTSSDHHTLNQHTARLSLRLTPGVLTTATPGLATPGNTSVTPAEYVGQVPTEHAWVGIATTSKRMVAFVTDGTRGHSPTFAQWFRGSIQNGILDASATAKNGSDHLQGSLNKSTATGTVTFANGNSLAFTANAVPASDSSAGLYRSEHEVNNQRYVAGWIVSPTTSAVGTATPGVAATAAPGGVGTSTPSTRAGTLSPVAGSPTPLATVTASPATTGALQQGSAILNEQTQAVLPAPPLTQEQINTKQIVIPNVATFKVVPCQQNLC